MSELKNTDLYNINKQIVESMNKQTIETVSQAKQYLDALNKMYEAFVRPGTSSLEMSFRRGENASRYSFVNNQGFSTSNSGEFDGKGNYDFYGLNRFTLLNHRNDIELAETIRNHYELYNPENAYGKPFISKGKIVSLSEEEKRSIAKNCNSFNEYMEKALIEPKSIQVKRIALQDSSEGQLARNQLCSTGQINGIKLSAIKNKLEKDIVDYKRDVLPKIEQKMKKEYVEFIGLKRYFKNKVRVIRNAFRFLKNISSSRMEAAQNTREANNTNVLNVSAIDLSQESQTEESKSHENSVSVSTNIKENKQEEKTPKNDALIQEGKVKNLISFFEKHPINSSCKNKQ